MSKAAAAVRALHVQKFQDKAKEAGIKLDLANAYLEDGALHTAAKLFIEAGNLLSEAAAARDTAVGV